MSYLKPPLERLNPLLAFAGGLVGGAATAVGHYRYGTVLIPAALTFGFAVTVVAGEVSHYRHEGTRTPSTSKA